MKIDSSQVRIMSYMVFNFLSSVGIINLNKLVFKNHQFNYPTFLTGIHFILTFVGLLWCNKAGMFKIKIVEFKHILPLALSFTGFVIFNKSVNHRMTHHDIAETIHTQTELGQRDS